MEQPPVALTGGTVYTDPDRPPIDEGIVVVDGGRIAAVGTQRDVAVPNGAQVLDCSGQTITAGFWNAHVHVTERKWSGANERAAAELGDELRDFTRYGFTSVFDLSSPYDNTHEIRERIAAGEIEGPRILTTGPGIVPKGAAPPDLVSRTMGWMSVALPEAEDPDQAAAAVRKLLDAGVDAIKLFASGPPSAAAAHLSEATMRAAVEAAHAHRTPVFVHPNTGDDLRRAVNAGVDVLAHTVPSAQSWEDGVEAMVRARVALVPTLSLWTHALRHDRASLRTQFVERAISQLASFAARGGEVLFGTDYGFTGADPSAEYALMARAGMSFARILASLTTAPARRFGGTADAGTIRTGHDADLVVLGAGASAGPAAFAGVRLTMRAGRILYRGAPPD